MKLLITGFDPFGGETVNPAWEAVSRLPKQIGGIQVIAMQIPTVFGLSLQKVQQRMEEEQPDVVISVGQAGGRKDITLERVAINLMDARIPDNQGNQPVDEPVVPSSPAAYFTTLPVKRMMFAIQAQGIGASLSYTAGSFVCNSVMYGVLNLAANSSHPIQAGFIHVPYLPWQTKDKPEVPSMELEKIVQGLTAAIQVLEQPKEEQ